MQRALLLAACLLLPACSALTGVGAPADAVALATIPIGRGPILLAMSPDGTRVIAATNERLAAIDTATNRIVASFAGEPNPSAVAFSADGRRLFVTHLFTDRLTVLDPATGAVLERVNLVSSQRPGGWAGIAVSPDRNLALVTNRERSSLGIVDLVGRDSRAVSPDVRPRDVAISADGGTAYIAGCPKICSEGAVRIFDTGTRRFTGRITVGNNPLRIVLGPDGRSAYTANLGGATVSVVDLPSSRTVATVPTVPSPTGLALSGDGNWLFVTSNAVGDIAAIDTRTGREQGRVSAGRKAREIVLSPDGRRAWVSTINDVIVLDTATLTGGGN
jgi:DNA-binding beta-propeller fold protein YncE